MHAHNHAQSPRSVARCACSKCAAARRFLSTVNVNVLADSASVLEGYRMRMWPETVAEARADGARSA